MKNLTVVALLASFLFLTPLYFSLAQTPSPAFSQEDSTRQQLIKSLISLITRLRVELEALLKTQGSPTSAGTSRVPADRCGNKTSFSTAFVLVASTRAELTPERINKLNVIKNSFANDFSVATKGLATMDTSRPLFTVSREELPATYSVQAITQKFYENNPDLFDFIAIYAVNGAGATRQTSYEPAQNRINGIGIRIFDNTADFGSKGRLLGVPYERDIDIQQADNTGTLVHEVSHQWCCYAGDSFVPQSGTLLGILDDHAIHFFQGLESSYQCATPMGARYWIPNGDGTFRQSKDCLEPIKFHPFQLYFMGLYNSRNFDLNKKFNIYYRDRDMESSSLPYKQVSINDIILVEGNRSCQAGRIISIPAPPISQ